MGDETNLFYPGRGIKPDRKRSGLLQVAEFPYSPAPGLCHPIERLGWSLCHPFAAVPLAWSFCANVGHLFRFAFAEQSLPELLPTLRQPFAYAEASAQAEGSSKIQYHHWKIMLALQAAIYITSPWASISWPFRPKMHNRNYTKSMFITLSFTAADLCIKSSSFSKEGSALLSFHLWQTALWLMIKEVIKQRSRPLLFFKGGG